jgi:hypothetical protein
MSSLCKTFDRHLLLFLTLLLGQGIFCQDINARPPRIEVKPQSRATQFVYSPVQLPPNGEVRDVLSEKDIPTGDGGFARDYAIQLAAGDQLAIDLASEVFDPVVILLNAEGKSIGKNDDGPDGSSNSLLFVRVKDAGSYVIRVQGFGETSNGEFQLKVSKLKAH